MLVAPFDDSGGGQTGVAVANELADLLNEQNNGAMVVRQTEQRPADSAEAIRLAEQHAADVLIWGTVQAGETLNRPALLPRLTYLPQGHYGPYAWEGYSTRFAMPRTFDLAPYPLNGQVIVPPVLEALARYHAGDADVAYTLLGDLLASYPLEPALPRALRGNILWARGLYTEAAEEYELALVQPLNERGRLANNLWVILQDGSDPAAPQMLQQTLALVEDGNMAALHYNMGMVALEDGRTAEAITELERARAMLPDNAPRVPLLVTLAQAHREAGNLAAAAAVLQQAEQRRNSESSTYAPPDLQQLVQWQYGAAVMEQKGLLGLAELTNASGSLLWALEASEPFTTDQLEPSGERLRQAVELSRQRVEGWQRIATASAASNEIVDLENTINDLDAVVVVASAQAELALADLQRQQYYLALHKIELRQALGPSEQNLFASILGGTLRNEAPIADALALLETLEQSNPESPALLLAHASARLTRNDSETDRIEADQYYDRIIALAPARPEGPYGKGQVALLRGDLDAARQWNEQALARDPAFYPAHATLARIAEEQGNWQMALQHLRVLAQQYPRRETTLRLASLLRQGGPVAYNEAQQVLQPLIDQNDPAALTELGAFSATQDR
ncbi:MAG: tetratricopeptide repeat protein [Chloroflexaceae bacterium]|nr:tetratricopeptide repeat protein [Chloroflexaceae bacterium]